ncbi:hypothetical protein DFH27DRAFT_572968 [Peziza echinospora]|nr:hypothetical protein DFH27DRAFT_572968 [Peziza echinospora]
MAPSSSPGPPPSRLWPPPDRLRLWRLTRFSGALCSMPRPSTTSTPCSTVAQLPPSTAPYPRNASTSATNCACTSRVCWARTARARASRALCRKIGSSEVGWYAVRPACSDDVSEPLDEPREPSEYRLGGAVDAAKLEWPLPCTDELVLLLVSAEKIELRNDEAVVRVDANDSGRSLAVAEATVSSPAVAVPLVFVLSVGGRGLPPNENMMAIVWV